MSWPEMDGFNGIYRFLKKSILHLKCLGVGHPAKVAKLPLMSPGAESMEYLNNQ